MASSSGSLPFVRVTCHLSVSPVTCPRHLSRAKTLKKNHAPVVEYIHVEDEHREVDVHISVGVLADTSVMSPRKIIILRTAFCFLGVKVSQKH